MCIFVISTANFCIALEPNTDLFVQENDFWTPPLSISYMTTLLTKISVIYFLLF